MNRTIYLCTFGEKPGFNFWKMGLIAISLMLSFAFLSSLSGAVQATAQEIIVEEKGAPALTAPSEFPKIKIKNFGQMDERFYRGAQPKPADYKALAELGIKTIIDLRDDPTSYEKSKAEAVNIRYVNIPMDDKAEPPEEHIKAFFAISEDAANWPFYVHCAGGRHRTGLIGAVYRYDKYGWKYEQVYKEMKNYDFYSAWGHQPIKDYVFNYYVKMKTENPFSLGEDINGVLPPTIPVTAPPPPKLNE